MGPMFHPDRSLAERPARRLARRSAAAPYPGARFRKRSKSAIKLINGTAGGLWVIFRGTSLQAAGLLDLSGGLIALALCLDFGVIR
jgi:hypothetical protein